MHEVLGGGQCQFLVVQPFPQWILSIRRDAQHRVAAAIGEAIDEFTDSWCFFIETPSHAVPMLASNAHLESFRYILVISPDFHLVFELYLPWKLSNLNASCELDPGSLWIEGVRSLRIQVAWQIMHQRAIGTHRLVDEHRDFSRSLNPLEVRVNSLSVSSSTKHSWQWVPWMYCWDVLKLEFPPFHALSGDVQLGLPCFVEILGISQLFKLCVGLRWKVDLHVVFGDVAVV